MNISKKKAIKILEEIHQIALNATLTGALSGPGDALFYTYNQIRDYAIKKGWVEEDLILKVSAETMTEGENWIADTGVAARLFAVMLEDEAKEYDANGFEIKSE